MTPVRWLVDRSALARLHDRSVAVALANPMARGAIGISILTELEMGYSARSLRDYLDDRDELIAQLPGVPLPFRAESPRP